MAMPDAIEALLDLAKAPRENLTRTAYNLTAFSPTAAADSRRGHRRVSGRGGAVGHRREAAGHRRLVARRRGRWRRPSRLGLRADVRFQLCVREVSDSQRPGALPMRPLACDGGVPGGRDGRAGVSAHGSRVRQRHHRTLRAAENDSMNALAERYVKLVLALGQHDPDYVDAYYGPAEWRTEAEKVRPAGGRRSGRRGALGRARLCAAGRIRRGSAPAPARVSDASSLPRCGPESRCFRARRSPSTKNRGALRRRRADAHRGRVRGGPEGARFPAARDRARSSNGARRSGRGS